MDIKLAKNDKRYIEGTDDVYNIMYKVVMCDFLSKGISQALG